MTHARKYLAPLLVAATVAACGSSGSSKTTATNSSTTAATPKGVVIDPGDGGNYQPAFDAAQFVETIDNPYLPFTPGSRWIYEGDERVEVTVTDQRREIMGVSAVTVRDDVFVDGELAEATLDYYAQDRDGNVWYMGEDTKEYENGKVSSAKGSWIAGVDGALPGIAMKADPQPGDAYRQEFYKGEAEDLAQVVRIDAQQTVPVASYDNVLVTNEWTPLEPDIVEQKAYARGVGFIDGLQVAGGKEHVELVEFTP